MICALRLVEYQFPPDRAAQRACGQYSPAIAARVAAVRDAVAAVDAAAAAAAAADDSAG